MYASRVIAGLIAGAIGTVAGLAAAAAVSFVINGDWRFDPHPAPGVNHYYRLAFEVGGLVFLAVMVAAFKALERTGLVADPPARKNTLGLTDRPVDPYESDPRFHPDEVEKR
jgi:hypothetical protein